MSRLIAVPMLLALAGQGFAATVFNADSESVVIAVTERGERENFHLKAGESAEFCGGGCFVLFPDDSRAALMGTERVTVIGGTGKIEE